MWSWLESRSANDVYYSEGTLSSGGGCDTFGGDDVLLHPKQNVLHRRDLWQQHGVLAAASLKSSTQDPGLDNVPPLIKSSTAINRSRKKWIWVRTIHLHRDCKALSGRRSLGPERFQAQRKCPVENPNDSDLNRPIAGGYARCQDCTGGVTYRHLTLFKNFAPPNVLPHLRTLALALPLTRTGH